VAVWREGLELEHAQPKLSSIHLFDLAAEVEGHGFLGRQSLGVLGGDGCPN
jgi:hypothetical protein